MTQIRATARTATDAAHWDGRAFLYRKTVFPQMARWLDEEERAQMELLLAA